MACKYLDLDILDWALVFGFNSVIIVCISLVLILWHILDGKRLL